MEFLQTTAPTPAPPSASPEQNNSQSGDGYEARFKGLQAEYNRLRAERDGVVSERDKLKADLDGSRATATDLQQRFLALQNEAAGEVKRRETVLTELQARLNTREQEFGALQQQVSDFQTKLSMVDKREKLFNTIAGTPEFQPLLRLRDTGLLDGLIGLEDETLNTRLKAAAAALGAQTMSNLQTALTGASPQTPATSPAPTQTGSLETVDQLQGWLMQRGIQRHPDYAANKQRFMTLIGSNSHLG